MIESADFFPEWTREDVDHAARELKARLPDAVLERGDYDYGLRVRVGNRAAIVFQPDRPDIGRRGVRVSVDEVIALLTR